MLGDDDNTPVAFPEPPAPSPAPRASGTDDLTEQNHTGKTILNTTPAKNDFVN